VASIDKIKTAKGETRWKARWRTPDGGSRTKMFGKKGEAERFLTTVEGDKLRGAYVDPSSGRVAFTDYVAEWAERQLWRPSSRARQEGIITNHLTPAFGGRSIASIRHSQVQLFVKQLSENLAPGTARGIATTLSSIYLAAVRDRVVAVSPCVDIKLPDEPRRRVEPMTLEEVEVMANAIGNQYRPLVVLGAGAGLRVGEALAMPVSGLDFLRRRVSVTQQSVTVKRVTWIDEPKTPASVRTVPMADAVATELAAYLEGHKGGDLLVADRNGEPIPQNRFSQTWARAARKAGLPKGTGYHRLRHTFASALIASGCSVKVVQTALGHESAKVTLDTYSHLWPDDDDRTRAAVDAFLGAGVSTSCQAEVAE
jgi:integrase